MDAGAPVLGGGWIVPRGRTGLPLRLADGRTVLVPTRRPAALDRRSLHRRHPRRAHRSAGDTGVVTSLDSTRYTYEAPGLGRPVRPRAGGSRRAG